MTDSGEVIKKNSTKSVTSRTVNTVSDVVMLDPVLWFNLAIRKFQILYTCTHLEIISEYDFGGNSALKRFRTMDVKYVADRLANSEFAVSIPTSSQKIFLVFFIF